jgi:hypothetical protein
MHWISAAMGPKHRSQVSRAGVWLSKRVLKNTDNPRHYWSHRTDYGWSHSTARYGGENQPETHHNTICYAALAAAVDIAVVPLLLLPPVQLPAAVHIAAQ